MPARGRPWDRVRDALKAECAARNDACWICLGKKGPINYTDRFNPKRPNPLLFSADHVAATSLGGDALRRANLKPAHYQRMQQLTRQLDPRTVPHCSILVTLRGGGRASGASS